MANKPKPPEDLVDTWSTMLADASDDLQKKRGEALRAEDVLRICVRDAFDAGLTVTPIREATGLTVSRLYQIKRGVRR
jgi:hypothetical protein